MGGLTRVGLGAGALLVVAAACATVPYTKRTQLVLLSEAQEVALGAEAYREVLAQATVVDDSRLLTPIRDVADRIAHVANKPQYHWEVSVIDDDSMINAFALPGGKIGVYSGLLPLAHDSGGLATVIGHEVAHALARHAGERMSQSLMLQIGTVGLSVALGAQSPATRDAVMQAFGLGAQIGVILPFSRSQEAEADHIGLILMAEAGYDPRVALDLWTRFETAGDRVPPEFLSTHPGYDTRQRNLEAWLPEALGHCDAGAPAPIAVLPSLAEIAAGPDAGDAAFRRYARAIDARVGGRPGLQIVVQAMATVFDLSHGVLEQYLRTADMSVGEVAVAMALANAGAAPVEDLLAAHQRGETWGALTHNDRQLALRALALLREVLIETRRASGAPRQPR